MGKRAAGLAVVSRLVPVARWRPRSGRPAASTGPPSIGVLAGVGLRRRTSGDGQEGPWLVGHAALWAGMAAVSAAVVAVPALAVAWYSPVLAVSLATVAGVVGLAVLQFGVFRYSVFGSLWDLLAGLAFGSLAVANLALRVVWPAAGTDLPFDAALSLVLFSRALAAGLLLLGLAQRSTVHLPQARTRNAWRWGTGVVVAGAVGAAAIVRWQEALPPLVESAGRALLESGALVADVLPAQRAALVAINALLGLAMLAAAVGYVALSRRQRDPHLTWIAVALSVLFFSQFHSLLFPPVAAGYVSTADAFRLGAYAALLYGLVRRIGREIEERAMGEERLRLSRELHDGLAQQLSLLHLRLARAAATGRPPQDRARDLEAAGRLVEAALLEARQVITTLRTGAVTWEELVRAMGAFADEFGENHDVDVRLSVAGDAGVPIGVGTEAELLRIAHEALSNALRHGAATEIALSLSGTDDGLRLAIRDNGCGFDTAALQGGAATPRSDERPVGGPNGLGLRSMRERLVRQGGTLDIESAPGSGAVIRAWLPFGRISQPRADPPTQ